MPGNILFTHALWALLIKGITRDVGGTSLTVLALRGGGGGGGGSQGPLHIVKVLFVSKFENIEWVRKRREKRMLISRVQFKLGIVGETNTKFIYSH